MNRSGFPSVFPKSAGTQHRVVLAFLLCRGIRLSIKAVAHRNARKRPLFYTPECLRKFKPDAIKDGRDDVRRMMILMTYLTLCLDALRPRNDQRVTGAA